MAYVIETTTTKPEGVQWFNVAYPEIYKEIYDIYQAHKEEHGILATTLKLIDSNTVVQKQIFLNEESSNSWNVFKTSLVPHQTRYQYNIENNINYTTQTYNV
jgi:hypothetical protein